ncbi:hypothetical protein B0T19DRAFT_166795 [Cercophora scortea]|uniref:Uncharacterized protein n=1 Tax=Cercophora scortea TaxID=314031 RepID=A0AAE0IND6_9PEZI|nr:hypothetical protein B0T19DRAFT_166795 [Cercophora scortea]
MMKTIDLVLLLYPRAHEILVLTSTVFQLSHALCLSARCWSSSHVRPFSSAHSAGPAWEARGGGAMGKVNASLFFSMLQELHDRWHQYVVTASRLLAALCAPSIYSRMNDVNKTDDAEIE